MNKNNLASLLCDDLSLVKISFPNTEKTWNYLSFFPVTQGEMVIVPSNFGKVGFTFGVVAEVTDALDADLDAEFEYKFLVSKLDTEQYDAFIKARDDVTTAIKRQERDKVLDQYRNHYGIGKDTATPLNKAVSFLKALVK